MTFDKLVGRISLLEAFPLGWAKAYSKRNNPHYKKESPYHEALEKLFKGKDRLVYYIITERKKYATS